MHQFAKLPPIVGVTAFCLLLSGCFLYQGTEWAPQELVVSLSREAVAPH